MAVKSSVPFIVKLLIKLTRNTTYLLSEKSAALEMTKI